MGRWFPVTLKATQRESFERAECPCCKRRVAVYVPSRGDGSDVKIVNHKTEGFVCEASGKMLGEISR